MRLTLRAVPLLLLWLAGLFPIALVAIAAVSPVAAVQTEHAVAAALRLGAFYGGAAALLLALAYPPFPAGIRLLVRSAIDRLRCDRGPYMRALGELRHLETPARQLEAGRAALLAGEPKAALPHLMRAIELEPETLDSHYRLGIALMEAGFAGQAIGPLLHTVERDPAHAFGDALLRLGRCHMLIGDHANAAALLTQHAKSHGGNRRSAYWLGVARRKSGDAAGAREAFAIAAAPPPARPRLTASEAFYRAKARVALLRGGR